MYPQVQCEIQATRERYALIDYEALKNLLGFEGVDDLATAYRGCEEESLREVGPFRDAGWTESVAVGSEAFVVVTYDAAV